MSDFENTELYQKLVLSSKTFKKKSGRHELKCSGVAYCSFSAAGITVKKESSQRDASKRIKKFGLKKEVYENKSVLDLGSHCGAMLLEICNFGIESGLGIEFDLDKVEIATQLAESAGLNNIQFRQSDIDSMSISDIGQYDIVMALSIEQHVENREALFRLLAAVTSEVLIFEGNKNCDVVEVVTKFMSLGFSSVDLKGFCDDDILVENNQRPIIVCIK